LHLLALNWQCSLAPYSLKCDIALIEQVQRRFTKRLAAWHKDPSLRRTVNIIEIGHNGTAQNPIRLDSVL